MHFNAINALCDRVVAALYSVVRGQRSAFKVGNKKRAGCLSLPLVLNTVLEILVNRESRDRQ